MTLEQAVQASLDALDIEDSDQALAALALRYARELDVAAATSAQADRVLRRIDDDPELSELVGALRAKLSARSAVENVGPKLQSALESLGATPKARRAAADPREASRGPSKLTTFLQAAG